MLPATGTMGGSVFATLIPASLRPGGDRCPAPRSPRRGNPAARRVSGAWRPRQTRPGFPTGEGAPGGGLGGGVGGPRGRTGGAPPPAAGARLATGLRLRGSPSSFPFWHLAPSEPALKSEGEVPAVSWGRDPGTLAVSQRRFLWPGVMLSRYCHGWVCRARKNPSGGSPARQNKRVPPSRRAQCVTH